MTAHSPERRPIGGDAASCRLPSGGQTRVVWNPREQGRIDVNRQWVVTRQQPVASLLAGGSMVGFTRSVRPPVELVGQWLWIHAGVSDVPYTRFTPSTRTAAEDALGMTLEDARLALPRSQIVGRARLVAAFCIAAIEHGRGTEPDRVRCAVGERASRLQLGRWQMFDGCACPPGCNVAPARLTDRAQRWLWCFEDAYLVRPEQAHSIKGFGGLWDLQAALAVQENDHV